MILTSHYSHHTFWRFLCIFFLAFYVFVCCARRLKGGAVLKYHCYIVLQWFSASLECNLERHTEKTKISNCVFRVLFYLFIFSGASLECSLEVYREKTEINNCASSFVLAFYLVEAWNIISRSTVKSVWYTEQINNCV